MAREMFHNLHHDRAIIYQVAAWGRFSPVEIEREWTLRHLFAMYDALVIDRMARDGS